MDWEPVVVVATIGVAGTLLAGPVTQGVAQFFEHRRELRRWEREDAQARRAELFGDVHTVYVRVDDLLSRVPRESILSRHMRQHGREFYTSLDVLSTVLSRVMLRAQDELAEACTRLDEAAQALAPKAFPEYDAHAEWIPPNPEAEPMVEQLREARRRYVQAARRELGSTAS